MFSLNFKPKEKNETEKKNKNYIILHTLTYCKILIAEINQERFLVIWSCKVVKIALKTHTCGVMSYVLI